MKSRTIKTITKSVLLGLLLGILLELLYFNFNYFRNLTLSLNPMNAVVPAEDVAYINWEERDGYRLSLPDPIIAVENLDAQVREITIRLDMDREAADSSVFYTTEDGEVFNPEKMLKLPLKIGENKVRINAHVHDLRIDPGEEAGLKLSAFELTINENKLHFSISRVVAVILIVTLGRMLFMLQESQRYEVE